MILTAADARCRSSRVPAVAASQLLKHRAAAASMMRAPTCFITCARDSDPQECYPAYNTFYRESPY
jgi:hypothetical protein